MQVLGEVPTQGEVTVPEELLRECQRQTLVFQILQVAFLQLIIVTCQLRVKGDALWQIVEAECLGEVQPLRLSFQLTERLPRLIDWRIAVIKSTTPLVFLLIDGRLARGITV